jgi:hypothetical protein
MMVAFLVWVQEVLFYLPDVVIFEITPRGTDSLLEQNIGHAYSCTVFLLSPMEFGWPVKRYRRFIVACRKQTVVFHGGFEDFMNLFQCVVQLNGGDMMQAPASERTSEMREIAAGRGFCYNDECVRIPLEEVLCPQNYLCLLEHRRLMTSEPDRVSASGVYLADVDQSCEYGKGSPMVPTLVKHGKIVNFHSGLMLTSKEHLFAQGERVYHNDGGEFPCLLNVDDLTIRSRKHIAGNAIHLHVLSALTYYVLASVEAVDLDINDDGSALGNLTMDEFS